MAVPVAGVHIPVHLRETGHELVTREAYRISVVTPRLNTVLEHYASFQQAAPRVHAQLLLHNAQLTLNAGGVRRVIVLALGAMRLKIVDGVLVEQYVARQRDHYTIRYRDRFTLELKQKMIEMDTTYRHVVDAVATFMRQNGDLAPTRAYAERLAEHLRTDVLEGRQFKVEVRESRRALNIEQATSHTVEDGNYSMQEQTFARLNITRNLLDQCNEMNVL